MNYTFVCLLLKYTASNIRKEEILEEVGGELGEVKPLRSDVLW